VSVWHARWQHGGTEALRSRGPSGPAPRLSDAQLTAIEQALLQGATANGFTGELWTLDRIATVIQRLTGIRHHPAWVWALLHHRLGWIVQRPKRRAAERAQAAIQRWVRSAGRGFCKRPTAQSLSGFLRRVRAQPDPQRPPDLDAQGPIAHLDPPVQLEESLHGGRAMRAWLVTQRSWLVVERLPAYAPDLNPVEGLWSSLKAIELANLTSPTLAEVIDQAHRGIDRVRRTPHLPSSFLRHAGLSVS
jgi:transposase